MKARPNWARVNKPFHQLAESMKGMQFESV